MPDNPEKLAGERHLPSFDHSATPADCGADRLDRWLNALPTDDIKREIAATAGDRPIRYYGPTDAVTMDFNPTRLNVELGPDGRIKKFKCG